jgi:hypothetical protein
LESITNRSPYLSAGFDNFRTNLTTEEGEECCNCEEGPDPKSYKKLTGKLKTGLWITGAVPGFGITQVFPEREILPWITASGILEAGLLLRFKGEGSIEASSKNSQCEPDVDCRSGSFNTGGSLFGGASFRAEADLKKCDVINGGVGVDWSCSRLVALGAETNVGLAVDVGINGTANISDECPSESCFGYKLGEAKALAEMELKFLVAGVFEGAYSLKHETVFWDGYSDSCN